MICLDCKESLRNGQAPATIGFDFVAWNAQPVDNITIVRRQNALALFQAFAEKAMASGAAPKGLEQAFAATLQVSPSMWSQIKASRPIGDKLARQIERHHGMPPGWLDASRGAAAAALTPAEKSFLDLALEAWRAADSPKRRLMRAQLTAMAAAGKGSEPETGIDRSGMPQAPN